MTLVDIAISVSLIVGLAVAAIGLRLLNAKRANVMAESKSILHGALRDYIGEVVRSLSSKYLPELAKQLMEGKAPMSKEAIGQMLQALRYTALVSAQKFAGSELKQLFGNDAERVLDDLIRAAADENSPFPGRSTSAILSEYAQSEQHKELVETLALRGLDTVRERVLAQNNAVVDLSARKEL